MNVRLFLPLLALSLVGCGSEQPAYPHNTSSSSSSSSSLSSVANSMAFEVDADGNFAGTVTVTGYPEIERVKEAFCETDCPEYDYVFFNVTTSDTPAFDEFLESNAGNSYVGANRIGLGCKDNNVLTYWNHSDAYNQKEFTLSNGDSNAILGAAEDSPITLTLTKLPLSAGSGAPTCYSHFTTINIVSTTAIDSKQAANAVPF